MVVPTLVPQYLLNSIYRLRGFIMTGQEVRRIRLALNLTQLELGMKLGHTSSFSVHCWETGKLNVPPVNVELLKALSAGFDVQVNRRTSHGPRRPKMEAAE